MTEPRTKNPYHTTQTNTEGGENHERATNPRLWEQPDFPNFHATPDNSSCQKRLRQHPRPGNQWYRESLRGCNREWKDNRTERVHVLSLLIKQQKPLLFF